MPHKQQQKQLINLFPLHPENLVEDHKDYMQLEQHHDDQVSDQVAFLFETATDDTSTSLHAILDSTTTTTTTSEEGSPLSTSLIYAYRGHKYDHQEHEGSSLVKTAMKCKERDASEERWVSYWEVVEKKEQEEVSSNCCYAAADALEKMVLQQQSHGHGDDHNNKMIGLVGLKLDYQEILNAWSDKGPLYIDGESPQTVPDLLHASNGFVDGCGNLWTVPELGSSNIEKEWKLGQREASVLRYKEKRQSRLFSKRIRYEVRKLNAEKRPRFKGRFVKRNGEE